MKEQTRYWLKTANNDLSVIEAILERKDLTPMVAFHAQQAIEKSLKAVLEEKETKVPRTHNLITLKELVEKYLKINIEEELLTGINETYIDTRYPTDLGLLHSGIPSQRTAGEFSGAAHRIFREVKEFLSD
ncbi:MAG TPA: HEPN domain-containing protein [Caldithrix sp.]|nr:HEPN domain-containing protein [Caldithrix sp.]